MIEDLPEEHTPNRALPQWAIDLLVFGMPQYTSAPKIWGQMLKIAMSAQARGWSQIDFLNEVTKNERRKNAVGQKRRTEHKLWTQMVPTAITRSRIWTRPGSRPSRTG